MRKAIFLKIIIKLVIDIASPFLLMALSALWEIDLHILYIIVGKCMNLRKKSGVNTKCW